jgi:hypothetical protein
MVSKAIGFLFLLCWINNPLLSLALTLNNNSSYSLRCEILARDGEVAGEVHLTAQSVIQWTTSYTAPSYGMPMSSEMQPPYTVNWYCENGAPYSSCSYVAEGSLVYSNLCPGALECRKTPPKRR